jgi:hypothetical protein
LQVRLSDWFKSDEHVILGKYFERMVGFLLHTSPALEVLLENHQLIKDERTTGEIDFVYSEHRLADRVVHLEVAVKYYLGYNHSQNHEDWIGPNGLDTLDRKMKKFQKQLGSSDELNDLIQRGVQKKQVLLMGYFFRHISSLKLPLGCHPFFQTRVQWMYERELDDYGWLLNEYYILPKYCWLSCTPNSSLLKYRNARDVRLAVKNELLRIGKGILVVGLRSRKAKEPVHDCSQPMAKSFIQTGDFRKNQRVRCGFFMERFSMNESSQVFITT